MANIKRFSVKKKPKLYLKKFHEVTGYTLNRVGEHYRSAYCPECQSVHENNPPLVVFDYEFDPQFYCHVCEASGCIQTLLISAETSSVESSNSKRVDNSKNQKYTRDDVIAFYSKVVAAGPESLTENYLRRRGIYFETWKELDIDLREEAKCKKLTSIAVYPLKNKSGEIVAIQRVILDSNSGKKLGKRYMGAKGEGVALLKDAPELIVSEGLENGLSALQFLGSRYGLLICGDSGNMKKLSSSHAWAVKARKKIIIAADNDIGEEGLIAARSVLFKYPTKTILKVPSEVGRDWNDSLVGGSIEREWI